MKLSEHTKLLIREVASITVAFSVCGIVLLLWYQNFKDSDPVANVGIHTIATPAKEVKAIPKVAVPVKNGTVRVYETSAKKKLKLPEAIVIDDRKTVVAATTVKADDHPQTTTTVLNTDTGEFETFTRKDPLPWLAWSDRGSLGLYAGIKNGTPTTRLEIKQQIFSVKAVHFGALATLDQPLSSSVSMRPDYFVGVGAEYRW